MPNNLEIAMSFLAPQYPVLWFMKFILKALQEEDNQVCFEMDELSMDCKWFVFPLFINSNFVFLLRMLLQIFCNKLTPKMDCIITGIWKHGNFANR